MALDAFGRERNGSQWILDLVGYSPRDFPPRSLLLRLEQVREILEHHHVARPISLMLEDRYRDRDVQRPARELHFHLAGGHAHAVGAPEQRLEILQDFAREDLGQRCSAKNLTRTVVSG